MFDIVDGNHEPTWNFVTVVPAKVAEGVLFATKGFIEIPPATNLANQQFTLDAWVRPDGPGPNRDDYGSVIIVKVVTGSDLVGLFWNANDKRFRFTFGKIHSEFILSKGQFCVGAFYHVAATYDGLTFRLYVNGQPEGEFARVKTVSYSTRMPWAIGASPGAIRRVGYPRTWNGIIDEVEIFNRALSLNEIQAIINAGSEGKCKPAAHEDLGGATMLSRLGMLAPSSNVTFLPS